MTKKLHQEYTRNKIMKWKHIFVKNQSLRKADSLSNSENTPEREFDIWIVKILMNSTENRRSGVFFSYLAVQVIQVETKHCVSAFTMIFRNIL